MLLRPGPIPSGGAWAFELKYDGFRAIVSTEQGFDVRSRRGWRMGDRVRELEALPTGLVVDGELVAFNESGAPHWPLVCNRVLHGDTTIRVTFVAFDVLRVDGHDLTRSTWEKRRAVLEELGVQGPNAVLADVFDDGHILFAAVCEHGLERIVAKRRNGLYHSRRRTWVKMKNPDYWRRDQGGPRSDAPGAAPTYGSVPVSPTAATPLWRSRGRTQPSAVSRPGTEPCSHGPHRCPLVAALNRAGQLAARARRR